MLNSHEEIYRIQSNPNGIVIELIKIDCEKLVKVVHSLSKKNSGDKINYFSLFI